MEGYLMTLIAVSLLSGIVGMISPEGDLKKYVRLVSMLCILCAMIGPALSLWLDSDFSIEGLAGENEQNETVDYDEIYNNALIAGGERQAGEVLYSALIQKFELSADSIEVIVRSKSKNDTNCFAEVTVILRDGAIFADPKEILAYVESMLDCRCTIIYE